MLPCPSRQQLGPKIGDPAEDHFRADDTCSYYGSLNPDVFMAKLEAAEISLGPTDKDYKVYVEGLANPKAGKRMVQTVMYGGGPVAGEFVRCADLNAEDRAVVVDYFKGREVPNAAVTFGVEPPTRFAKFYFEHLSVDQRKRFVELLNEKRLRIEAPGYFYRRPFFVQPIKEKTQ